MVEHYGYCNECRKLSPAFHEEREGRVFLVKDCPDCGRTETVVSSDSEQWRAKRRLDQLERDEGCKLNCTSCSLSHSPTTVFVDVTNRCNQACPICIANVPTMGFKFEPPFEYFEKVFGHLATLTPKPSLKLFGGEPTVREDLPEIVRYARRLGLSTSIVTNGLRFADEAYCKELLPAGAKLIFAFDGRDEETLRKLRGSGKCYAQKLKAIENIRKHRKGRMVIMCIIAKGINDHLIADLFRYCHERRDLINALEFIPLTRTWAPGAIEADGADITAMEDAEKIVAAAVPGDKLEFLPAGLTPFNTIARYLPMPRLTFAGAHPNCESVAFLVSDGEEYVPVTNYLKGGSLFAAVGELVDRDAALGRRMERVHKGMLGKLGLAGLVGRALSLKAIAGTLWKHANRREIFGEHAWLKMAKISFGLLAGRKAKRVLRRNTRLQRVLRVVILPFEEPRTLDSAKLKRCPAAFAYEDPDTREVRTMPACAWGLYKNDILRRIMENYSSGTVSEN